MVDQWTVRRLADVLGQGPARAMLLAADTITGQHALALGLVQRIGTCDLALEWAHHIATLAPLTIAGHKIGLNQCEDLPPTTPEYREAFLRNAMFTGRISALPPVTWSRKQEFRLIRPLVYVGEDLTRRFASDLQMPVIPCGCSQKTGTVRRTLRDVFATLEEEHPFLKETLLSAMGKIDTSRLLDTRFLDLDGNNPEHEPEEPGHSLVTLLSS